MKKERILTTKEQGFIKDLTSGMSGVESAKKNYNTKSYNSAGVIAHTVTNRPAVKAKLKSIADSIPNNLLIKKHIALLNKEETYRDADGVPMNTGQIDVQAVSKGLDMAYKIKGCYPKEGNMSAIQINIGDKVREMREE